MPQRGRLRMRHFEKSDAFLNDPFAALLVILRHGKNTCNT